MTSKEKTIELIKRAMQEAEWMPCGVIGEEGATQRELDEAIKDGHPFENDDTYHRSQQIWLHLNNAVKILEGE